MSELRQRRPMLKKPARMSAAEKRAKARFEREVYYLDFGKCVLHNRPGHVCDQPSPPHHCVRQQTLRAHVSTLGLSQEELWDWIWHPDVAVTICQSAHARHTSHFDRIALEELPARVADWATDREILHLLKREHPPFHESD